MPRWWPFGSEDVKQPTEVTGSVPVGFGFGNAESPPHDYAGYANNGYAKDELVYACIRELSTAVTEPNYRVLFETNGEPVEAPYTNPISSLLYHPNPDQDFYNFIDQLVVHLNIAGNVYLHKGRNNAGQVVEMRLLRPDRIKIKSDKNTGVTQYEYSLSGGTYTIPADDISHMKYTNPTNDLYGLSPLTVLAKTINLDLSQIEYAKAYFMNAGVPSGILKVKRRLQNEEQADTIRNRWRSTFGGPANLHRLAVMDEDASYEQLGSSMADVAFPELRDTVESRICMAFGVPPILIGSVVGLNRATYSNYREARQSFFTETLTPLSLRIVRFLNHCLEYEFPDQGYIDVDFNNVAALTEDADKLATRLSVAWNDGLISMNEARSAMGFDPIPAGDVRKVSLQSIEIPLDSVAPPPPPPAEPAEDQTTLHLSSGELKALPSQLDTDSPYEPLSGVPATTAFATAMIDMRIQEADSLEPKLNKFFRAMTNRVDGVMGRYLSGEADSNTLVSSWRVNKAPPIALDAVGLVGELIPNVAMTDLSDTLRPSYARMIKGTFAAMNKNRSRRESQRVGPLEFDPKNQSVQRLLSTPSQSAKEIVSYTQRRMVSAIYRASEKGYTTAQLANGIPEEGFTGIKQIARDAYANRTKAIARTETAKAQNLATITYAKEQGIEYVRAYDPDGDENDKFVPDGDPYGRTCAERHMQIYSVSDAYDIVDHPNGSLQWFPVEPDSKDVPTLDGITPVIEQSAEIEIVKDLT